MFQPVRFRILKKTRVPIFQTFIITNIYFFPPSRFSLSCCEFGIYHFGKCHAMSSVYDPREWELKFSHALFLACINTRKGAFKTCSVDVTEGVWMELFSGGQWRHLERTKKSSVVAGFWTASWADVVKVCGFSRLGQGFKNIRAASRGSLIVVVPPMLAEARGTRYKDGMLWKVVLTFHVATIPCLSDARLTLPAGYPQFWDVNAWFELPSYGEPRFNFMQKMQEQLQDGTCTLPSDLLSVQSVLGWEIPPELGPPSANARDPPPLPPRSGMESLVKLELSREKARARALKSIWRPAPAAAAPATAPATTTPQPSPAPNPPLPSQITHNRPRQPLVTTPESPYVSSDEEDDFWKFEKYVICSGRYASRYLSEIPMYPGEGNWKAKYGYYTWKRKRPS